MNHETSILWLLALLTALLAAPRVDAAALATPQIAGYSGGKFSSPAGSFSMTAANDGFVKPSVINVGGRPVTIPATLRVAANAGSFIKSSLRLTPWGLIAGTLAASWLADQGMEWVAGQGWMVADPLDIGDYYPAGACIVAGVLRSPERACFDMGVRPNDDWSERANKKAACESNGPDFVFNSMYIQPYPAASDICLAPVDYSPGNRPATPEDWDSLPDPIPALAPELPHAPYLPEGVPVDEPEFSPQIVPLGLPYTAPDGSTWQPKADIQPAGDGKVRVRTFDDPLTDPQGNPVPSGTPPIETETPPESPKIPDICVDHPDVAACAKHGDIPAPDVIPTHTINFSTIFSPIGGSGTCPADVTSSRFGITWSYQPICDFAAAIRPIFVAFAWLGFGFIIVAGLKK